VRAIIVLNLGLVLAALGARTAAATDGPPPPAASFDCGKATQWAEKAICSDAQLAALDRRLARVFAEARRELAPDTRKLLEEQRAFLGDRQDCTCGEDLACGVECLSSRYEQRAREILAELPLLENLRRPVSAAQAERLFAIFRLMTQGEPGHRRT
jgi:uncharacterized protein